MSSPGLTAYWLTFPDDSSLPLGLGVTAWSVEDAYALIEAAGIDWLEFATRVHVKEAITFGELNRNVVTHIGPIVVRGVWYPAYNIGFGAPGGRQAIR